LELTKVILSQKINKLIDVTSTARDLTFGKETFSKTQKKITRNISIKVDV